MALGYILLLTGLVAFGMLGIFHKIADHPGCRPKMITVIIFFWGGVMTALYTAVANPKGLVFPKPVLLIGICGGAMASLANETLFLPVQWLGASAHHLGMAGTLTAENETYLHLVAEPLRCLLRHGFQRVFILNGHGGNVDGFHLALRQLAVEFPRALLAGASYWDVAESETAALLEGRRKTVGHACEFETSLMLYLKPELVRRHEIADDDLIQSPDALRSVYIPLEMKRQTRQGGTGQPTLATAEKGKALFEAITQNLIKVILELRQRPMPRDL